MRLRIALSVIACVLLTSDAGAQATASIAGTVVDASGAVLPGVTVEASSPALIEKVRIATTDGSGQYRIEQLRGGVYRVTFTLQGFQTVRREGLELAGSFAATVNAELNPGSLEETVTVTGESPVVDLQSAQRQRVINQELLTAIPTGPHPAGGGVPHSRRQPQQRGCRRHEHHQHHRRVAVDPWRPCGRHTPSHRRHHDREHRRHGMVGQRAAQHGQHARGVGGLLLGERGEHHRWPADQHDPEDRWQHVLGHAVRDRGQLRVRGHQHQRRAGGARPPDAQHAQAPVRHQPRPRRSADRRQAVVLHLGPVHAAVELCGRAVPEQERLRPGEVDLRARPRQPGLLERQRREREPAAHLADEPDAQTELLLRPALALPVPDHGGDGVAGGRQRTRIPDQRPALRVVHRDADQPAARRSALRRPPRGVCLHARTTSRTSDAS